MMVMEQIRKTENLEFDLVYHDGTKKRVHEGVLFEADGNKMRFHNGTNRAEVILALADAIAEVIDGVGLSEMFMKYAAEEMDEVPYYGWIPVDKKLPEEPDSRITEMEELKEYIVTIEGAEGAAVAQYAGNGDWYKDGNFYKVHAWRPIPEAYKMKH